MLGYFLITFRLQFNMYKSPFSLFNMKHEVSRECLDLLRTTQCLLLITYLGLPLGSSLNSPHLWLLFIDRLDKRISRWKGRLLSRWGRLVLLRVVLQDISTYFMFVFRIPKSILTRIYWIHKDFFWSVNVQGHRYVSLCWLGWDH